MIPIEDFLTFNNAPNSDSCLEVANSPRRAVTDIQAKAIISKISRCSTITEFQALDEKKKARYVRKFYEKGVSVRQISRLSGISKGIVEKYLKT